MVDVKMKPTVALRNVSAGDVSAFFQHHLDPEAHYMAAYTPKNEEEFTAHWMKILSNEDVIKQTILTNGQIAGNMLCFDQFGKKEIGYWIEKKYWGQGIATAALELFLLKVTERPLFAHVAKHNIGSLKVLQKCGFEIIGEDKTIPDELGESVEEFVLKLL